MGAVRIPTLLGLIGLQLVESDDDQPAAPDVVTMLENHRELLAEEEHNARMEVKLANGWKPAPPPQDREQEKAQRSERRNHCLVPYAELSVIDKDKDRVSVRNFPTVATPAGFKIVARRPLGN